MKFHANSTCSEERTADSFLDTSFSFENMLLPEDILKGLSQLGFHYPTVIQRKGIPVGRCGYDLLIQSKSGTGKTLVFSVIALEKFSPQTQFPQSLIIAPTREIAVQTKGILSSLGSNMANYKAECFIGGLSVQDDRRALAGCSTVVGTPGRILHLITSNMLNVKHINLLVLDEVDVLLEDNFELDKIIGHLKGATSCQVICVSATVDKTIESQVAVFMKNPVGVTPKREVPILIGVGQFRCRLNDTAKGVEMLRKFNQLKAILSHISFKQCLVFVNSQSQAESYKELLLKEEWPSEVMTGAYDQRWRLEAFRKLREYKIRILLTTDLMARGIDAENVNLVINMDVPSNGSVYLHRIGRAGRFGTKGIAITMTATEDQDAKFEALANDIGLTTVFDVPKEAKDYPRMWKFLEKPNELERIKVTKAIEEDLAEDLAQLLVDECPKVVECVAKPEAAVDSGSITKKAKNLFEEFDQFSESEDVIVADGKTPESSDTECAVKVETISAVAEELEDFNEYFTIPPPKSATRFKAVPIDGGAFKEEIPPPAKPFKPHPLMSTSMRGWNSLYYQQLQSIQNYVILSRNHSK